MASMLMISSRKSFWSSTRLSDTDEIRDVGLDDDSLGRRVAEGRFLDRLRNRRVHLLIHGYNNEEDDVVRAYGIVLRQMTALGFIGRGKPYDMLLGYTWPGGRLRASFPVAKARAGAVAPRVARWLAKIVAVARAVDINTHSLGARVALLALAEGGVRVRHQFHLASAVDDESIEFGRRYYPATQACDRFYVFHSKHDQVLRVGYRLGDLPEFDAALGWGGPEDSASILAHSPNVRVVNCKQVIDAHGAYKYSREVYGFMRRELTDPQPGQFFTLEPEPPEAATGPPDGATAR